MNEPKKAVSAGDGETLLRLSPTSHTSNKFDRVGATAEKVLDPVHTFNSENETKNRRHNENNLQVDHCPRTGRTSI